ncbi:hypothetical protein PsAD46_03921 [Pseudovibrio sp. Ad46]|nr:hypothetical protein PsAD46_03921 [Pseudovibrio sp. Ad46]
MQNSFFRNTSVFAPHLSNRFYGVTRHAWFCFVVLVTASSICCLLFAYEAATEANGAQFLIAWTGFIGCLVSFWAALRVRRTSRLASSIWEDDD